MRKTFRQKDPRFHVKELYDDAIYWIAGQELTPQEKHALQALVVHLFEIPLDKVQQAVRIVERLDHV